ncbi:uncharacterized protein FPOAC1_013658 [Fusarium poae]|uniref:uncharacterized protein n=1 Tax=Fusarium poae TaxID=36050 RepID=UPI001D050905|nr:uncharacterized protein FPOAC1_013658 [Fusarium poae]KAG8664320.1 hypothetical protein FPOAC1_013658 [Fusarium poae]
MDSISSFGEDLPGQITTPTCIAPGWLHVLSMTVVEYKSTTYQWIHQDDPIQEFVLDADVGEGSLMSPLDHKDITPCDWKRLGFNSSHLSLSPNKQELVLEAPLVTSGHREETDRSTVEEGEQTGDLKRRRLDSTYSKQEDVKLPSSSNSQSGHKDDCRKSVVNDSSSPSRLEVDGKDKERKTLEQGNAVYAIHEVRNRSPTGLETADDVLGSKKDRILATELGFF